MIPPISRRALLTAGKRAIVPVGAVSLALLEAQRALAAEQKLSALPGGKYADYIYGIEGGTSSKYSPMIPTFNVLNYGADPSGNTDSSTAIQHAVNDAMGGKKYGGIIYFPTGGYLLNKRINISGGFANLTLLGAGGHGAPRSGTFGGTAVFGNFRDFLIKSDPSQSGQPIRRIQGISFTNNYSGAPPSSPSTENVPGCLYLVGIGTQVHDCEININGNTTYAVGIYAMWQGFHMSATSVNGNWGAVQREHMIGVWTSGHVSDCKFLGLGTGINLNVGGTVTNVDLEVGGNGIVLGRAPIAYYDAVNGVLPPGSGNEAITSATLISTGTESNHLSQCYLHGAQNVLMASCAWNAFEAGCPNGIRLFNCNNSCFINSSVAGSFTDSAVDFGTGSNYANTWISMNVYNTNTTGGVTWKGRVQLPAGTVTSAAPNSFINCIWQDGATPFSDAPTATGFGQTFLCNNLNAAPTWGQIINSGNTGTGSVKAMLMWNGKNWVAMSPGA